MSSVLSTAGSLHGAADVPAPARRDWRSRVAARLGLWRDFLTGQEVADGVFARGAAADVASRIAPYAPRPTGDVLAGQPAVVIPLNRAVVCGEDHVYDVAQFSVCPNCAAEESLAAVGPGVERLQEEAAALFPGARTMVLSSDLITSIETMRSELNEIAEGRVDIIIGTQLVAKGHHFPRLNLVGVVDADLGLGNGDPSRRARPGSRHRLSADPSAGASGDAGADRL